MPITPFLARQSFDPEAIEIMSAAFVAACDALYLKVGDDPATRFVAEKIIEWAQNPLAVIDCFGILDDDKIKRYFELGCEVKGLGRGHIQRIKENLRKRAK